LLGGTALVRGLTFFRFQLYRMFWFTGFGNLPSDCIQAPTIWGKIQLDNLGAHVCSYGQNLWRHSIWEVGCWWLGLFREHWNLQYHDSNVFQWISGH
jgi:hypothetical protein